MTEPGSTQTPAASPTRDGRSSRRRLRTALRAVGFSLLAVVAVVLVVLASVWFAAPVRTGVLQFALPRVLATLPGTLVLDARWPRPGSLEIRDLRWTLESDTLATLAAADLDVDLGAAIGRRIHVRALEVRGARIDLDRVLDVLVSTTADSVGTAGADSLVSPLQSALDQLGEGRVPFLPRAQVDRFSLVDLRVRASARDLVVEELSARIDLTTPGPGEFANLDLRLLLPDLARIGWGLRASIDDSLRLDLDAIGVHDAAIAVQEPMPGGQWRLARDAVGTLVAGSVPPVAVRGTVVDGDLLTLRVDGHGDAEGWSGTADLILAGDPTLLRAVLAEVGVDTLAVVEQVLATWPSAPPYSVSLRGNGEFEGPWSASARLDLPGPSVFVDTENLPVRLANAERTLGQLTVHAERDAPLRGRVDLGRSAWLDRLLVAGSWDGSRARIDTLAVRRPGLDLQAQGWADREGIDARTRITFDTDRLFVPNASPAREQLHAHARGELRARGSWPLPELRARLDGGARGAFGSIPSASLELRHDTASTLLDVRFAEPAQLSGRDVDEGRLRFEGQVDANIPRVDGRVSAAAEVAEFGARVDGRVHYEGRFRATVDSLRMHVAERAWHVRAPFSVHGDPRLGRFHVEGLDLEGDGGRLRADATLTPDSLATDVLASVVLDRALLESVLPDSLHASIPADTTNVELVARVRGPLSEVAVHARLELALDGAQRIAPLRLRAELGLGDLVAMGDDSTATTLDPTSRRARAHIELAHGDDEWMQLDADLPGRLDLERGRFERVPGDSLHLALDTQSIDVGELLALAGLDPSLRGAFSGHLRGDLVDSTLVADADLGIAALTVSLESGQTFTSDVRLLLRGRAGIAGWVDVDSLRFDTVLGGLDGRGRVTREGVDVDLRGGLRVPRGVLDRLLAGTTGYSLPADTLAVGVDLHASGSADAPSAFAELTFGLRGGRALPPLTARARAWLNGEAPLDAALVPPAPATTPARGLRVEFDLAHADSVWIEAQATLPARISAVPASAIAIDDAPLNLDLRTKQLDVAQLATLAGVASRGRFSGRVRAELHAQTQGGPLLVDGRLDSGRLRADLPDGSWLQARAQVRVKGDAKAPEVGGEITVEGAVMRLPEVPPPLHDAQGEALLWTDRSVPSDAENGAPPETVRATPDAPSSMPQLDVRLAIPGNVRLQGGGLDVELQGDLRARTENGEPGIVGELRATRGSYSFLGRRFEVRSGTVQFFGDLDPTLDLRLSTTLQSTIYYLNLRGSAEQPRLELSSDPEQSEGDIVSALLFGRPLDQLDEGQTTLLRQRTQEVAAQLGANLAAQRIGQQIGVDVLAIQSDGSDGTRSLVVGKYLSPDVLVQYERVLEEGRAALVRIEYALSRFFRVETTASQGEHSGVELKWSRDY